MSPSNLELLAQAFTSWGEGRPGALPEVLHPDCELLVPESLPYGGTFRGADAVIGWFTGDLWRWFETFSSTPEGVIDGGDQIAVQVLVVARARTGRGMEAHNVWIVEFADGRLLRGRVYADTAVVLEALRYAAST
jgi:hypothetical protein